MRFIIQAIKYLLHKPYRVAQLENGEWHILQAKYDDISDAKKGVDSANSISKKFNYCVIKVDVNERFIKQC